LHFNFERSDCRSDRLPRQPTVIIAKETDEVGKPVTEYLSLFELLATGVNTDVFDLGTIERVAGGRVRSIAKNYRPWIDQRRRQFDSPLLYEEIEQLGETLEDRHAIRIEEARARQRERDAKARRSTEKPTEP
jgi:hypothetical protein